MRVGRRLARPRCAGASFDDAPRHPRPALAAARVGVAVGDRGVPARDRDRQHGPVRAGLRRAAHRQRRADRAADGGRRLAAVATASQPEGRCIRLAPGAAPRVPVRAGGGAARRARLRGLGAVHRAQHRELVRRAHRSRAGRGPEPRPQRARLPAQGEHRQGAADGAHAVRRAGQPGGRHQPRGGAGQRLRSCAVLAHGRRARRGRHRRFARHARAAAGGRATARAHAAAVREDRAGARRRTACCAAWCRSTPTTASIRSSCCR